MKVQFWNFSSIQKNFWKVSLIPVNLIWCVWCVMAILWALIQETILQIKSYLCLPFTLFSISRNDISSQVFMNMPSPVFWGFTLSWGLNIVCVLCINLQSENVGNSPTFTDTVSQTAQSFIITMSIHISLVAMSGDIAHGHKHTHLLFPWLFHINCP